MLFEWPTFQTYVFLLIGFCTLLIPTIYYKSKKYPIPPLLLIFLVTTWAGYHLSALLGLVFTDIWGAMVYKEYVDDALLYSSMSMVAFTLGFILKFKTHSKAASYSYTFVEPSSWLLLSLTVVLLFLFFVMIGGLENLLEANYERGETQFKEKDFLRKLQIGAEIGAKVLSVVLTVLSALVLTSKKATSSSRYLLSLLAITVSSFTLIHYFSRVAGMPLIVVYIFGWIRFGKLFGLRGVLYLFSGLYLSFVGYFGREYYDPGLGNFFNAAFDYRIFEYFTESIEQNQIGINLFDASGRWTIAAWVHNTVELDYIESMLNVIAALQPMPSQLLPWSTNFGLNLSEVIGTTGVWNVTAPLLAEIHFAFGYIGLILMFLFGILTAVIENLKYKVNSTVHIIVFFLFIISFVMSIHSGVRAITRPITYALFLLVVNHIIGDMRINRSRTKYVQR